MATVSRRSLQPPARNAVPSTQKPNLHVVPASNNVISLEDYRRQRRVGNK